ncbi:hypothetical protein N657DRAFT_490343 [Parathielavia appendiculata]|uniref:Uncharacterized protein n=1 Tax=Parathielavia appendiculata TaxID=2587402 RepID=A0AAN6TNW3_9PEZI|nr:hypothetical protein N657DRAFT_490343 [Parathielavia appendiculata]
MTGPHSKRGAFSVSYRPAVGETVEQFQSCIEKFVTKGCAFFGAEEVEANVRYYRFVLCLRTPLRITSLWSGKKWKRAGAFGVVVDVCYPALGEGVGSFLSRQASLIRRRSSESVFGSWDRVIAERESVLRLQTEQRRQYRKRERRQLQSASPVEKAKLGGGPLIPKGVGVECPSVCVSRLALWNMEFEAMAMADLDMAPVELGSCIDLVLFFRLSLMLIIGLSPQRMSINVGNESTEIEWEREYGDRVGSISSELRLIVVEL